MMSNHSSAVMRHHQAAAAQQNTYMSSGGGRSSSAVMEAPAAVSYDGKVQASGSVPGFQRYLHGISLEWAPEEQAILEEGLVKFASESNIKRYAKIAGQLKNKTIRDVAMRCKWLAEIASNPSVISAHASMHLRTRAHARGGIANDNNARFSYAAVGGITGQLLQQNARIFKRISSNVAVHQTNENIALLCRARENILDILNSLTDPPNLLKKMPPLLVKIDEKLANSILPDIQGQR